MCVSQFVPVAMPQALKCSTSAGFLLLLLDRSRCDDNFDFNAIR